ncbi:hypothetical protein EVJ58_g2043 [Rhodofomes roseus]|uniref:RRM domain-containing protein n=1 Tax=Rhodofomes roseus TaxID=34475 RepID=A0A4Y9YUA8_9APHY|nr:hypothetical protein EVJ58_g2043 [Rhodofomes roseus]
MPAESTLPMATGNDATPRTLKAYLPGPQGQNASQETVEEPETPDEDVAQDKDGNPARKRVMITKLPPDATLEELTDLLDGFGECVIEKKAHVSGRWGFAHVLFRRLKDAQAFLRQHKQKKFRIDGQTITVLYSDADQNGKSEALFIRNLPRTITKKEIYELFRPYGYIRTIDVACDRDSKPIGYAHVRFRVFICRKSCPVMLEYAPPAPVHHEPHNKLFARMVDGDETGIRALFGSHAQNIRKIEFYDHSKVDPVVRAAYIEFDTTEEATAAKDAVNQQSVNGRSRLVLSYAKKGPSDGKSKKPSSPVYLPVPQWKSVYEGVEISPDAVERMKSLGLMTPPLPESQR